MHHHAGLQLGLHLGWHHGLHCGLHHGPDVVNVWARGQGEEDKRVLCIAAEVATSLAAAALTA